MAAVLASVRGLYTDTVHQCDEAAQRKKAGVGGFYITAHRKGLPMSNKSISIFYDYACPYCYQGLQELADILPDYPKLSLNWSPCETRPWPEPAVVHSDLAAQVAYFLLNKGLNIQQYNTLVYEAHFEKHRRIDDVDTLVEMASLCGADPEEVRMALARKEFLGKVLASNREAWETLALEAVPSYQFRDKVAGSGGGLLVPISKVIELMRFASQTLQEEN